METEFVRPAHRKQGEPIPFTLGFFTREIAAVLLNLTERRVIDFLKIGRIPAKYQKLVRKMGDLTIFPTEAPPPEYMIGTHAYLGIEALREDKPEIAEALAARALKGERDFETGKPLETTDLQMFYARLVQGMAWSQSPKWGEVPDGLPALKQLHDEVIAYMTKHAIDKHHRYWKAWRYLKVACVAFAAAYYVAKIGLGFFTGSNLAKLYKRAPKVGQRNHRKEAAKFLLDRMALFEAEEQCYKHESIMSVRLAWNIAQLAALADNSEIFLHCFKVLKEHYDGPVANLVAILNEDNDTGPMLRKTIS